MGLKRHQQQQHPSVLHSIYENVTSFHRVILNWNKLILLSRSLFHPLACSFPRIHWTLRTALQRIKRNEYHNMNYGFICEKYICMFYSNWTKRVEADKSSSQLNTHTLVTLAIVCRDMAFANATPKTLYQTSIFTLFLFLHTEFALKTIENHHVDNNFIQQRQCIHVER